MTFRRSATAAAVLVMALTGCMDEGENVPDAGDQETPAPPATDLPTD